ncbi:MAG: SAM-dependent MidA family methyltransferase [Candidatus Midichloriaceae bacterium]|jgi:SAM-dependent MidA family methyltransferase
MQYNVEQYIKDLIKIHGYITLDHYMKIVSNYYYSYRDSIGPSSDFITAPEISQMFGEMIGIYLCDIWYKKFQKPFSLVELGPGNGTMMSDILRTIQNFPDIMESLQAVHLVETSKYLINKQKVNLKRFKEIDLYWHENLEEVDGENLFIVANEFFDALPIKQLYVEGDDVKEICVASNPQGNLCLNSIDNTTELNRENFPKNINFLELSADRDFYSSLIANKIFKNNGCALIVDYGYNKLPNKSTLQAIKNHKKVGFFEHVGSSDITSLVDFQSIQNIIQKFDIISNSTTQGEFLINMGIETRAQSLINSGASKEKISKEIDRLCSDKEMGNLFKVLEIIKI